MDWNNILENIEKPSYTYSNSRSSIWRRKNKIVKSKKLYFGIGLSFNIDGNRNNQKQIYKKQIEKIKHCLSTEQLEYLYSWIDKKYTKISKTISISNSKGKLFMQLLWILPYVKENFKQGNIEGFIARILYNSTRSWSGNYYKKNKEKRFEE